MTTQTTDTESMMRSSSTVHSSPIYSTSMESFTQTIRSTTALSTKTQSKPPTPTISPSQILSLDFSTNISMSSLSLPTTSSHIYHPIRIGPVLSPTDVPAKWGPKDLDTEKHQRELFLAGMVLLFVLTMAVIIGVGCWSDLWASTFVPRTIERAKRGLRSRREREREVEEIMQRNKYT